MAKNYWMVVGSPENYDITKDMGFTLHGLGRRYRRRAERMRPEDRVLYYVTEIRKWTTTATITSRSFEDHTPIWRSSNSRENYPYRVKLAPDIVLDESDYIDALILAPRLEYVKRWAPEDWPLAFVETLHLLPQRDFRLIEGEMKRIMARLRNREREEASEAREGQLAEAAPGEMGETDDEKDRPRDGHAPELSEGEVGDLEPSDGPTPEIGEGEVGDLEPPDGPEPEIGEAEADNTTVVPRPETGQAEARP